MGLIVFLGCEKKQSRKTRTEAQNINSEIVSNSEAAEINENLLTQMNRLGELLGYYRIGNEGKMPDSLADYEELARIPGTNRPFIFRGVDLVPGAADEMIVAYDDPPVQEGYRYVLFFGTEKQYFVLGQKVTESDYPTAVEKLMITHDREFLQVLNDTVIRQNNQVEGGIEVLAEVKTNRARRFTTRAFQQAIQNDNQQRKALGLTEKPINP